MDSEKTKEKKTISMSESKSMWEIPILHNACMDPSNHFGHFSQAASQPPTHAPSSALWSYVRRTPLPWWHSTARLSPTLAA
jgi:hypothetical protein